MGGLKRYVLEAGPSGAGDKGTICMGGAKALCSAFIWLHRFPRHLVRAPQNDCLGPRSNGGPKRYVLEVIWLYRIANHLVRGLQNDSLGPRSMGGPKRYVLEAVPSGAGGTGTICMGGEQGSVLCSHLALQNCLSSCQGPPNTSSRT